MYAVQELESDVETVFPGIKRRKVGKVKVTCDMTSEDALPSSEAPSVTAADVGSDGKSWKIADPSEQNRNL